MKKVVYVFLTIILGAIIFCFSITPGVEVAGRGINAGKLQHLVAYLLLSFLVLKSTKSFRLAVLLAGTYGFLIEIVQYVIPYRAFQISDVFLNYLGACSVLLLKLKK